MVRPRKYSSKEEEREARLERRRNRYNDPEYKIVRQTQARESMRKFRAENPELERERTRKWRQENPDYQLFSDLRKKNITVEEYLFKLEEQDGKCAICGEEERAILNGKIKRLAVDHDHSTGKIRSLLCGSCNGGLGLFKDSIEVMERAIEYLRSHQLSEVTS